MGAHMLQECVASTLSLNLIVEAPVPALVTCIAWALQDHEPSPNVGGSIVNSSAPLSNRTVASVKVICTGFKMVVCALAFRRAKATITQSPTDTVCEAEVSVRLCAPLPELR